MKKKIFIYYYFLFICPFADLFREKEGNKDIQGRRFWSTNWRSTWSKRKKFKLKIKRRNPTNYISWAEKGGDIYATFITKREQHLTYKEGTSRIESSSSDHAQQPPNLIFTYIPSSKKNLPSSTTNIAFIPMPSHN